MNIKIYNYSHDMVDYLVDNYGGQHDHDRKWWWEHNVITGMYPYILSFVDPLDACAFKLRFGL